MPDALPAHALPAYPADQPRPKAALPLRNDTMLGVCEGLGEEFGLDPLYLRLAFAGLFYWNPPAVVAAYLALGLALAFGRWVHPVPRPGAEPQPAAATQPAPAANQSDPAPVPIAA